MVVKWAASATIESGFGPQGPFTGDRMEEGSGGQGYVFLDGNLLEQT